MAWRTSMAEVVQDFAAPLRADWTRQAEQKGARAG